MCFELLISPIKREEQMKEYPILSKAFKGS